MSTKAPDSILLTKFAGTGGSPAPSELWWAEKMRLVISAAEVSLGGRCSPMIPIWSSWSPGGMWSSAR